MSFHLVIILFVYSRTITNAKEEMHGRPHCGNRVIVNDTYFLDESDLLTMSTTETSTPATTSTLTSPDPTPHNPTIPSSSTNLASTADCDVQEENLITLSWSELSKNPEEQFEILTETPLEDLKLLSEDPFM